MDPLLIGGTHQDTLKSWDRVVGALSTAHIRLVAGYPGFWELRSLQRVDGTKMEPRGSFFLIVTDHGEDLVYDRLEAAVDWVDYQAHTGAEVFIGMNPRVREGKDKASVERVTACFVDLDLPDGETQETALAAVTSETPPPSLVVNSGYGLHVVYLLETPAEDKVLWKRVQRGPLRKWKDLGADAAVATDESRVLRLVPYQNRKKWATGVETGILYQSAGRYTKAIAWPTFK